MVDYFQILEQPRRPWLDAAEVKAKFLSLSATAHPDRVHDEGPEERAAAHERFATLNAASNCLQEPKDRLLHLLELERGTKPGDIQRLPPGAMELFVEVGQLCRSTDEFLAERNRVSSPLLRVALLERGIKFADTLKTFQQALDEKTKTLCAEVRGMNAAWEAAPPSGDSARAGALPLERLEEIYRRLSYLGRWSAQIRERIVQLSMPA